MRRFLIVLLLAGLGYWLYMLLTKSPVEGHWVVHPALTQTSDNNWYRYSDAERDDFSKATLEISGDEWITRIGEKTIKSTYKLERLERKNRKNRKCYKVMFDGKPAKKWGDEVCFKKEFMVFRRRTEKPRFVLVVARAD